MDKQKLLFKELRSIKDYWTNTIAGHLNQNAEIPPWNELKHDYLLLQKKISTEEELDAFKKIINETIDGVIHSILVMIDGGSDLADIFKLDLIDRETGESLTEKIASHEEFFSYLLDVEEGD